MSTIHRLQESLRFIEREVFNNILIGYEIPMKPVRLIVICLKEM
jgi:hypothetical protein